MVDKSSAKDQKVFKEVDFEYIGSKDESAEERTIASRARLRDQLEADIEAFLSEGGEVRHIQPNVLADPPRKPTSNYGGRPI